MSKEYVWELEVDEVLKTWTCVVHEDECVTYENGVECQRLPITNKTSKRGVLQIDTVANVLGEELPFHLEENIPHIKVEDKWIISDTTREERLAKTIKNYKIQIIAQFVAGILFFIAAGVMKVNHLFEDSIFMMPVMGIFFMASGAWLWVRLRDELAALGRKFTWKN